MPVQNDSPHAREAAAPVFLPETFLGREGLVRNMLWQLKRGKAFPSRIPWPLAHYERLTVKERELLIEMKLRPILGLEESAQAQDETRISCIRMGPSNEELAKKRKVTIRTIKAHVTNIYEKLQVVSPHHSPTHRQSKSS